MEIQAVTDWHGKIVSLGERECSIQRRNQKLLEEAPSVAVDQDLRERLSDAAMKGLAAAGYANAGTVEFLLDNSGEFYFLEVNKRLQVEHLVTELTTRVDLVEEQLNVAFESRMNLSQNEIHVDGWAINCRINAEDPRRGFAPAPGKVIRFQPPAGPGVRVDTGLYSGLVVQEYYDSMIAKLAVWGRNRAEAIQRMRIALDELEIVGTPTTVPLHRMLMEDDRFKRGDFDTSYLNHVLPRMDSNLSQLEKFAAVTAAVHREKRPQVIVAESTQSEGSRWRTFARTQMMKTNR